ncbi:TylF/MycF family methyltransferase [Micromonospora sp. WMMD712]|uniref:TylF/MycF family methyltransferase n=1 Tax=Micromonospora sp. WMMD712 TaxID=3016096 RepID=UPI002499F60E|nr:TylF/MycF family methyltransferase [Micromonospora sp. WMMD712]WFE59665.1 TylF/MycF family methyltransferase [Micromonospora sp. WMMD712]
MEHPRSLYLDLLEKVVTNLIYEDPPVPNQWLHEREFKATNRENGKDWPSMAHTMVGLKRIRNIRALLEQVIADGVPGDFIETGVWRGGVCIMARGVFEAYGIRDRTVWVADSFEGIPDTGADGHPMDQALGLHHCNDVLGIPVEVVQANFARYGLLDDQVRFLPGWFSDTLPHAPISQLAVLRLDGDLYESTRDALTNLYAKVSPGGYVVIDDYVIPACRKAVQEFRAAQGVTEPLQVIDEYSVYWRRAA